MKAIFQKNIFFSLKINKESWSIPFSIKNRPLKENYVPVEHPEEFESESVHSTGSGREKSVQSCLSNDLTW